MRVFPKIRGKPPKWMVYHGKPYQNWWFGGTPIFGNTHMESCFVLVEILGNDIFGEKTENPQQLLSTINVIAKFWIRIERGRLQGLHIRLVFTCFLVNVGGARNLLEKTCQMFNNLHTCILSRKMIQSFPAHFHVTYSTPFKKMKLASKQVIQSTSWLDTFLSCLHSKVPDFFRQESALGQ